MKDITNRTFGRLTAIEPTGEKRWRVTLWRCKCECGNETVVAVNTLRSGYTRSCGCLAAETARNKSKKHGMFGSRTYATWSSMVQRCTNPNGTTYNKYGGRGIKIAPEWLQFANFLADMGERPEGASLDRIDPTGDYTKNNCRWADKYTQARNKRRRITTFEQAERVRELRAHGLGPKAIAQQTGVSIGSVTGIIYCDLIKHP